MRRSLILLAALLPLSVLAANIPPALQALQKKGGLIGQSFIGPDGLTGWVVTYQGKTLVVYTTSSGNYVLNGEIIDTDGNNLTAQYTQRYAPPPDLSKLAAVLEQDPMLVDEGDTKAPPLYVFADPNCIYCNQLWNEIRPFVQSGKVQVRWVIVSFLKQSSDGRATAILTAKDRLAAFTLDESKFDKAHEEGGIPPVDAMSAEVRSTLMSHDHGMFSAGGQGTPFMVFRSNGNWYGVEGLPSDLKAFVGGLEKP